MFHGLPGSDLATAGAVGRREADLQKHQTPRHLGPTAFVLHRWALGCISVDDCFRTISNLLLLSSYL